MTLPFIDAAAMEQELRELEERIRELKREQLQHGHALELVRLQRRQEAYIEWVRSLPTPPSIVLHPSEYLARQPAEPIIDELLTLGRGQVEDLRVKKPNGAPLRILDPENLQRRLGDTTW